MYKKFSHLIPRVHNKTLHLTQNLNIIEKVES